MRVILPSTFINLILGEEGGGRGGVQGSGRVEEEGENEVHS